MINKLKESRKNIFSQKGEDGVLEQVFQIIKSENKWCVEFGAWDGKHYSNTCNLVMNHGWSGIFIESDKKRFEELKETYNGNGAVIAINKFITFGGEDRVDSILSKTQIPKSFDLISIDIDGNDYHIWDSIIEYKPNVVIIEFNPTIPGDIEFIQPKDMNVNQGSSLLALRNLGKKKGYELVATTYLNAIFVKKEYFDLFNIKNNSVEVFENKGSQSQIFQLYDGTIVLSGRNRLLWHDIKIKGNDLQIIPRVFRTHPDCMGRFKKSLFKIWRKIHNHL